MSDRPFLQQEPKRTRIDFAEKGNAAPAEAGGKISSPAGTYRNGANAQQSLGNRAGAVNAADLRRDEARIHLCIPEGKALEEIIRQLGDIVKRYPGQRRIEVCMEENGGLSDGKFSTVSREKGIQRGD